MVDVYDLALIRTDAALLLTASGNVLTKVSVDDGAAGQTTTWTTGPTIACTVVPLSSALEAQIEGRLTAEGDYLINVPAGTVDAGGLRVSPKDRFLSDGVTYEIKAVLDENPLLVTLPLLCKRVQ